MKTKVTINNQEEKRPLFSMSQMEPGQICIVVSEAFPIYNNNFVMRTLDSDKLEVMNLSKFEEDTCWTGDNNILVRPAPIGTKIIFEVVE